MKIFREQLGKAKRSVYDNKYIIMMQYDPTKVDLNHSANTYANHYLSTNQPQYRTDNINQ